LGKVYTWLYRHDRAWLKKHKPIQVKPVPHNKVNWGSRDEEIARSIPAIVNQIIEQPGKPTQVTRSEIGRRLEKLALIQRHIEKLPLTNITLLKHEESRVNYGIRRIKWAKQFFREKNIKPKTWEIAKKAGVDKLKKWPEIIQALDIPSTEQKG
jgi:hypothetical protein